MFKGKSRNSLARRLFWSGFTALLFLCPCIPVFSQDPEFISFLTDTDLRYAITCSPDGKNVYAGGLYTLAAFRVSVTGELETLQVLNNDYKGVKDLRGIINLTVSPDGRFLYAVSSGNQTLLIFSRNTNTGRLTLKQAVQDNVFGRVYSGFFASAGHNNLLFSPDGKQLYWQLSALTVFQRNVDTGEVTPIQLLQNNDPMLGNLGLPSFLTIAPDGKHLYGGKETHTRIMIFARDPNTGILRFQKSYETNPGHSRWDSGHLALSQSSQALYASNPSAYKLMVLQRNLETGELHSLQKLQHEQLGYILVSPRDGHVFLRQQRGFAIYAKEDTSERLALKANFVMNHYSISPERACISPLGTAIYTTDEGGLTTIQIDSATAGLKVLHRWDNHNIGGLDHLQVPRSVAVSRNGKFVYVATSYGDPGINVFKRDSSSGQVTFSSFYPLDEYTSGRMYASPEGRHLYLVRLRDKKLQVFSADEEAGAVRLVQTRQDSFGSDPGWGDANNITFSRNGRHAYLNAVSNISVYERNLATGELAIIQKAAGRDFRMGDIYGLTLSPESDVLYTCGLPVSASSNFQLSTFARDTLTGQITFVRNQDFKGIFPVGGLVVSPDHRHVYVTLNNNDDYEAGVFLGFARNPVTGQFTIIPVPDYRNYYPDVGVDIAISNDGRDVYFTEGNVLAMLERNPETGVLTERKLFLRNQNNVYGISGYTGLALSPDNRYLYASAETGLGTFTTGRSGVSAVQEEETRGTIPRALVLEQNYPNPMHAAPEVSPTTIRYEIPEAARVELAIYNLQGQLVRTLVDEIKTPGKYSASWNGRNAQGGRVPSGIYFYRVHAGNMLVTRRLLLL